VLVVIGKNALKEKKVYYGMSDFHSNAIHNRECTNLRKFVPVSSS